MLFNSGKNEHINNYYIHSSVMAEHKATPVNTQKYGFLRFEQVDKSQEKKAYGEELRLQMEEQKKARLKEKEEYIASPKIQKQTAAQDAKSNSVVKKLNFNAGDVGDENKENLSSVSKSKRRPLLSFNPYNSLQYPYYGYNSYIPTYIPSFYPGYTYPYSSPNRPLLLQSSNTHNTFPDYDPYLHYGIDRMNVSTELPKSLEASPRQRSPQQTRRTSYLTSVESRSILNIGTESTPNPKQLDSSKYYSELRDQIAEKNARKLKLKEEEDAYNRKVEAEAETYSPWGKGGSGAPFKKVVTFSSAEGSQKLDEALRDEKLNPKSPIYEARKKSPSPIQANFGRVNKITGDSKDKDPYVIAAKVEYQSYLRRQIEERETQKLREKELQRLEEAEEAKRFEKERELLKLDYEKEVAEKKRKDDMYRKINEELKRQKDRKMDDSFTGQLQTATIKDWISPRDKRSTSPLIPSLRGPKNFLSSPTKDKSPERSIELRDSIKESPQKVISHLSPNKSTDISPIAVDKYKEHVMNQLLALRSQLNRLQEIKQRQSIKNTSYFDTRLLNAAKQRSHKRDKLNDVFVTDLEEPVSVKAENLDNQSTSNFMMYSPEPKNDRIDSKHSHRKELVVPDIQQSNLQRLRRLERDMENSMSHKSPTEIIDKFLMNKSKRSNSEVSMRCETTLKPI